MKFRRLKPFNPHLFSGLAAFLILTGTAQAGTLLTLSADRVEARIEETEAALASLPEVSPNNLPWTIGYASSDHRTNAYETAFIELRFTEPAKIDLVALMPATFLDDQNRIHPFGFPERFLIERILPDESREPVSDFRDQDFQIYGSEPQLFPCPNPKESIGLRITTTQLPANPIWWKMKYLLALSEIFAFSGDRNVALNATVQTSDTRNFGYIWHPDCLTDGFSLYSHVKRDIQNPMDEFRTYGEQLILDFDLGAEHQVDEFRLWPVIYSLQENFAPAAGSSFPTKIIIQRLATPTDSDPKTLFTAPANFPRPGSNPYMHQIAPTRGRWFRVILSSPLPDFRIKRASRISLAEVELLEQGTVLTRHRPVSVQSINPRQKGAENPVRLTDGRTNEGYILPLRTWLEEFKQRADLKRQLDRLRTELEFARGEDLGRNRLVAAIAVILIMGLTLIIWLVRLLAERRANRMREQIACDLHDEVGANLSSIAHSTELVKKLVPQRTELLSELLDDTIVAARATAAETRQFVQVLEERKTGLDINGHIQSVAGQILKTIEYTCTFDKSRPFNQLNPTRKWDLLFFVKEALNNVIKHSGADQVEIVTHREGNRIQLIIEDNGRGIPDDRFPLRHLESRAKKLNGELTVETSAARGTQIILSLSHRRIR